MLQYALFDGAKGIKTINYNDITSKMFEEIQN